LAIRITCESCGRTLQAKDTAAGKKVKCPGCEAVIQVPEAGTEEIYDAEETPQGEPEESDLSEGLSSEGRRPCPQCGEMIKVEAAKCRFCGEIFDAALKKEEEKKTVDAEMTRGDWAVSVLCSGIGCIAGIVYMIQGKPKGLKMVGVSFLFAILWNIVVAIFEAASEIQP